MQTLTSHISRLKKRIRGFTLIETLIAVLLLATAIAGPLTLASKGLSAALIARDQMTAFYLAQDAVEYVRFVRDSNRLASGSWLTTISTCFTNGCYIDPTAGTVTACSTLATCPLLNRYANGASVKYSYTQGAQTPQQFKRTILLIALSADETAVVVDVSWRAQSGVTRTVTVRETIFNWQ